MLALSNSKTFNIHSKVSEMTKRVTQITNNSFIKRLETNNKTRIRIQNWSFEGVSIKEHVS